MVFNDRPFRGRLGWQHLSLSIAILVLLYFQSDTANAIAVSHNPCSLCHLNDPPAADASDLIQPLPDLCISCHYENMVGNDHVINIPPSGPMYFMLPLLNGLITCTTCHDPHGSTTSMLRLPAEDLCFACHRM